MKLAIISDIHANITALKIALDFIDRQQGIERIICLGDLVGFNTAPGECVDLIQERQILSIAGNHDAGVVGTMVEKQFPWECWEAIQWTRRQLNERQLTFLRSLAPQKIVEKKFWIMHGIFADQYHYMVGNRKHRYAFLRLRAAGLRLAFYGHIHQQTCFETRGIFGTIRSCASDSPVLLDPHASYLINPGTIGQPRTLDAFVQFAIVDFDQHTLQFHRIPYDYSAVLARTLEVFPRHAEMYRRFGSLPQDSSASAK